MQALTHRGVEARAQVSHGVTTYHFRTRAAMIAALLEHICDRQIAWVTRMYDELGALADNLPTAPADREAFTARIVQLLLAERPLTLARYELYLHAARDPQTQRLVADLRARHVAVQAQMFAAAGAPDPEFAANRLLSLTDGMLLYQLSAPEADFEQWAPGFLVEITDLVAPMCRPAGG